MNVRITVAGSIEGISADEEIDANGSARRRSGFSKGHSQVRSATGRHRCLLEARPAQNNRSCHPPFHPSAPETTVGIPTFVAVIAPPAGSGPPIRFPKQVVADAFAFDFEIVMRFEKPGIHVSVVGVPG